MLQNAIHRFTFSHHYWRHAGISELSELYASILLRNLGMNLIGVFVPIYLYKLGYALPTIFLFLVMFFAIRVVSDVLAGYFVARFGPKHAFALSATLLITHFTMLLSLQDLHWPLFFVVVPWSFSMSLYLIALHTEFSKIKHTTHGGKELGYTIIFERMGHLLGPLVGGLVATLFDARYTIAIAIAVLIGSLIPIFLSPEPVRTKQTLRFKGLAFKKNLRNYVSFASYNFESAASIMLWPLLVGVTVFTTATYAKLGILISLSMAVTLIVVHSVGKAIDSMHSKFLMKTAVLLNGVLHISRPFLLTSTGVVAATTINEPLTVCYRMPIMKSFYDAADHVPGQRIAFITSFETVNSFSKMLFWVVLWIAATVWSPLPAMQWIFIIVGLISLLMLKMKFKGL